MSCGYGTEDVRTEREVGDLTGPNQRRNASETDDRDSITRGKDDARLGSSRVNG